MYLYVDFGGLMIATLMMIGTFIAIFILRFYKKSKSQYNKLKTISIASFIFGLTILLVFGMIILLERNSGSDESDISQAEGFTIEEYKVTIDVNESNVVNVQESININFYEDGHHGIYKVIPSWLKYTNKDGITQSRESKISDLQAVGEKYTVENNSGKKRIRIGDENYVLTSGSHNYNISYKYDMGKDPYDGFDEFIFHAFGDYWGTEIKNASLVIHLPKSFDSQNKIKFFADKYRKNDITSNVNYYVEGNTIYAFVSPDYMLEKSLTIDIELPDGYFISENNNYGLCSLILCIICILFPILSFIFWIKNGKDLKNIPETVEFYPPESLDSAEVGYLYKKDSGKKLAISLIVELASKGFIKIIESEDKKTQTIIKNNSNSSTQENQLKMTTNEEFVYNALFISSDEIVLSDNKTFYTVFSKITENIKNNYDDKINDLKAYKYMVITSIGFSICAILWVMAFVLFEDLDPKLNIIYVIAYFTNFITLFFAIIMTKKNSYGEEMISKIKGFRNFLVTAEKEKINMLVEENSHYFYDILPYAYVLGVSKKWIEKFENIPIPSNDMGNFDYCNISSLDSLSDSVSIPSSSSSSGCSSCGGGCSSCGGGGSW